MSYYVFRVAQCRLTLEVPLSSNSPAWMCYENPSSCMLSATGQTTRLAAYKLQWGGLNKAPKIKICHIATRTCSGGVVATGCVKMHIGLVGVASYPKICRKLFDVLDQGKCEWYKSRRRVVICVDYCMYWTYHLPLCHFRVAKDSDLVLTYIL